jgi:hypothetical protein
MNSSTKTPTRRVLRIAGFLAAGILAVWLFIFASDHVRIVRLDNMYSPKYGDRVGRREEYFDASFPSFEEIESYLSDATLVFSQPPGGNRVYYFDRDHRFISWSENVIEAGKWWTSPGVQIIRLGHRWRFAVVQHFCTLSLGMPADAQQDNCYAVEKITSLLSQGLGSKRDYRKGNVLGLSDSKPAPFRLPDTPVTIDSLLSIVASKKQ